MTARGLQQVDLIAVGSPDPVLALAVNDYQQRLSALVGLRVATIPSGTSPRFGATASDEALAVAATIESIEQERGERFPILLGDEDGDAPTSQELALTVSRLPYLCVVLGGVHGLPELLGEGWEVRRLSFGRMTLGPTLTRVVVLDQLCRALVDE